MRECNSLISGVSDENCVLFVGLGCWRREFWPDPCEWLWVRTTDSLTSSDGDIWRVFLAFYRMTRGDEDVVLKRDVKEIMDRACEQR